MTLNRASLGGRSRAVLRARAAVCLTFFCNGLAFSNLVPRYPEIVERLAITKAAFGQAVMAGSIGALVAGLAASALITRWTSARVASAGMALAGLAYLGAGTAENWHVLAVCLALGGGLDAIIDVAQNAHGLRVERRWGSSIITSFHAAWSLGAVCGALMGQWMAASGVPIAWHLSGVVLILAALSLAALRWMIPGPDSDDRSDAAVEPSASPTAAPTAPAPGGPARLAPPARASRLAVIAMIVVLGAMCAAAMFPEDVSANWSPLLLVELRPPAGMVGMGLVTMQATMIVGRLIGDRIIDALGGRRVIAAGGALVVLGMGTGIVAGTIGGILVGMVLAGAGCAVAVPVAFAAADGIPGLAPGVGLTIVSWLARVIMMIAPPVVGMLADAHGTWVALGYGILGGVIMIASWPMLHDSRPGRGRQAAWQCPRAA
nr:MFS transporter [Actinomyces gaoshouyii]